MTGDVKDWSSYARAFREQRESSAAFLRESMERIAATGALRPDDLPGRPWLDVGAGSGRLSGALADYWDRDVIALERQPAMLAERAMQHPRVRWVRGDATAPPFAVRSVAGVLLHSVVHQIGSWRLALERVGGLVAEDGVIAIRTLHPGKFMHDELATSFPRLTEIHAARFPKVADIVDTLEQLGFAVAQQEFDQIRSLPREAYFTMIESKTWSSLRLLDDAEFAEGLVRLRNCYPESVERVAYNNYAVWIVGRR